MGGHLPGARADLADAPASRLAEPRARTLRIATPRPRREYSAARPPAYFIYLYRPCRPRFPSVVRGRFFGSSSRAAGGRNARESWASQDARDFCGARWIVRGLFRVVEGPRRRRDSAGGAAVWHVASRFAVAVDGGLKRNSKNAGNRMRRRAAPSQFYKGP